MSKQRKYCIVTVSGTFARYIVPGDAPAAAIELRVQLWIHVEFDDYTDDIIGVALDPDGHLELVTDIKINTQRGVAVFAGYR